MGVAKFNRTLCDTENIGKLNREQFALAMYFIAEKVKNNMEFNTYVMLCLCRQSKYNIHRNYKLFVCMQVRGKEPPTKLTPQMIPPSCRNKMQQKQQQAAPLVPNTDPLVPLSAAAAATVPIKPGDYSAIKELDTLHGEVEQLGREKLQLKQELVEKQDAIQQKKSEIDVST